MVRRLWTYRPGLAAGSLLLWTLGSCVPILTGLATQQIFDRLQGTSHLPISLWALFGALAVIAVVQPALLQIWLWTHLTFETTIETLVRTNLFEWILVHAGRREAGDTPAKLVGLVRDDAQEVTSVLNEWYRLSGEAVFVVGALVIMARIDWLLTVVTFVPLALVVLFSHWLRSRLPKLWASAREATTDVTALIGDVFGGIHTVKAAGAERAVLRRLRQLDDVRRRAEVRSRAASLRIEALTDAVVTAGQGLVLLVAARAMLAGRFSVGDFTLFTLYLNWTLMLPRRVGRLLSQRKESNRASRRIAETMTDVAAGTLARHRPIYVFGELPGVPVPKRTSADALREVAAVNLSYRYPRSDRGIHDVTLRLPRGTVTVVTGEVGAGKSTLVEVLLGLRTVSAGEICWNGTVIQDVAAHMVPPRVAYKPQLPRLFSDALADNLLLGLPRDRVALDRALYLAAFDSDVADFELGLDTILGSRGVRLSGGQLQRAGTARMFIREPELYVIDDLSSALDVETERLVWDRLAVMRADAGAAGVDGTYLIVSHRADALRRADQIVVLRDGRLVACGPLQDLQNTSPEVRRILGGAAVSPLAAPGSPDPAGG